MLFLLTYLAWHWASGRDVPHRQVPSIGGSYVLGAQLGSGGFGVVYKGVRKETHDTVAIKVIQKQRPGSNEEHHLRQVQNEIAVMTYLDHPNVVQLFEVLETDDAFHLIMEYVEGGDLSRRIRRSETGKLDDATSRSIMRQLVDALSYCHRSGVVHRDLKPGNSKQRRRCIRLCRRTDVAMQS